MSSRLMPIGHVIAEAVLSAECIARLCSNGYSSKAKWQVARLWQGQVARLWQYQVARPYGKEKWPGQVAT